MKNKLYTQYIYPILILLRNFFIRCFFFGLMIYPIQYFEINNLWYEVPLYVFILFVFFAVNEVFFKKFDLDETKYPKAVRNIYTFFWVFLLLTIIIIDILT